MNEVSDTTLLVLLVAGLVLATMFIKILLSKTALSPLVGYLFLGICLRLAENRWGFLNQNTSEVMVFLANIGLFALLFRVGAESKLDKLLAQLKQASLLWMADVIATWALVFCAAHYILGIAFIPNLIISSALTATSVGVSVSVWHDAGALDSKLGSLLVDVAELDDISAILLMAMLFSMLPVLHQSGGQASLLGMMAATAGWLLVKLAILVALCIVFARYLERRLTTWLRRMETPPRPMLMITGLALLVSALAGLLGFSLAVGAFLAGLVFSRDPAAMEMETSFIPLHDFFAPFFFIGIGYDIDPSVLGGSLGLGVGLVIIAILSKNISDGLPVLLTYGTTQGILIGASMIPRAEISMVVMQQGLRMGDWAISPQIYGAMVLVSLVTCLLSPPSVRALLKRWPPH